MLIRSAATSALVLALCFHGSSGRADDCGPTPYDCAMVHVTRHEFTAAIRILEPERAAAPGNLKVQNLLGIALTGAGRVDEANARFRAALKLDPGFYPALKNLAVNEFNRGHLAEAERHMEAVLKHVAGDEIAHLHLAEIQFQRKRLREALPHYEMSRARLAQNPVWLLHYATCLLDQGQRKNGVAILEQLEEKDAESRFEAGLVLGRSGDHADAARFFESARAGYRDPYAAAYNQVLMLVEGGSNDAAIAVAEKLLAEGTRTAELLNLLSKAHGKAGHVKEAYDALRAATVLEPSSEENYLDLAAICLDHENYDLGIEVVDIGLRQRPESLGLRLQRGVLLAQKGMVAQAEDEFDAARKLAPESPAPYVGLAMAWMQTGQTQKAVEVLRERAKAARVEPMVSYILGVALVRSGAEPDGALGAEAVSAFEAASRSDPRFQAARAELGKLLLQRGEVDRAIEQLEKAMEIDPGGAGSAYMLARAYQRKGDKARAQEMLRRVDQLRTAEGATDPDADLRRVVIRIVREQRGAASHPFETPRATPE